jgi:hypothetical protein
MLKGGGFPLFFALEALKKELTAQLEAERAHMARPASPKPPKNRF